MMRSTPRIILAIASLLLVLVFFFPLWKISLGAPQYPEGIGLKIWVNQITGDQKHHLQLINALNKYIGMKEIHPTSIKELKIMPWAIAFLMFIGLLASVLASKKLAVFWLVAFMVLGLVGLIDFYIWEYSYGHDLSPDAPIKVPGMTYQPPLIGSKKLLNITATSYPHLGAWVMFLSMGLGILVVFYEKRFIQHRLESRHDRKAA